MARPIEEYVHGLFRIVDMQQKLIGILALQIATLELKAAGKSLAELKEADLPAGFDEIDRTIREMRDELEQTLLATRPPSDPRIH